MEKFFIPTDRAEFIKWLLQKSNEASWTILFEYSTENTYKFLNKIGTEVSLPTSSRHEYHSKSKLTAIRNIIVTDITINQIMLMTHVLSIHDNKGMIFLIADDFHEECFSSSIDFYKQYRQMLVDMNLADIYRPD